MRDGQLLLDLPFLLPLTAGAIALASAALLRRAAPTLGDWLRIPAGALRLAGAAALVSAYAWAWSLSRTTAAARGLLLEGSGWAAALLGVALALWAVYARALQALNRWSTPRLYRRPPYARLRRPILLGLWLVALGGTLTADTLAAWIALAAGVALTHLVAELEDWELAARRPEIAAAQRGVPRYLPRLRRS
jgi:protein-S-isoprenylcysteine O-methyltransferase Ste14